MILSQKQQSWHKRFVILGLLLIGLALGSPSSNAQAPKGDLPPHQATLAWTAGTGTTGSNAYRCPGTCSLTSGTFTVLNSAPITATSYVDTGVTSNTPYSWCVTGLVTLSTGPFETACSSIVTATIPKDAAGVPSGLAVGAQ